MAPLTAHPAPARKQSSLITAQSRAFPSSPTGDLPALETQTLDKTVTPTIRLQKCHPLPALNSCRIFNIFHWLLPFTIRPWDVHSFIHSFSVMVQSRGQAEEDTGLPLLHLSLLSLTSALLHLTSPGNDPFTVPIDLLPLCPLQSPLTY